MMMMMISIPGLPGCQDAELPCQATDATDIHAVPTQSPLNFYLALGPENQTSNPNVVDLAMLAQPGAKPRALNAKGSGPT